jgi:hypothetical protein
MEGWDQFYVGEEGVPGGVYVGELDRSFENGKFSCGLVYVSSGPRFRRAAARGVVVIHSTIVLQYIVYRNILSDKCKTQFLSAIP